MSAARYEAKLRSLDWSRIEMDRYHAETSRMRRSAQRWIDRTVPGMRLPEWGDEWERDEELAQAAHLHACADVRDRVAAERENTDSAIARISAFRSIEALTLAIEEHGYTPTLRIDPEAGAQHRADVLAVRAALQRLGVRVHPPTLPDEEIGPTDGRPYSKKITRGG